MGGLQEGRPCLAHLDLFGWGLFEVGLSICFTGLAIVKYTEKQKGI